MTSLAKIDMKQTSYTGIAASPGISIGEVHLLDRRRISVQEYDIEVTEVDEEIRIFLNAVDLSRSQLQAVQEKLVRQSKTEHFYIIDTQLLILNDKMLIDSTTEIIRTELINAAAALKKVLRRFVAVFEQIEDEYLRERGSDVELVGERIIRNIHGMEQPQVGDLERRSVIVAHDLSPADTCQLDAEHVVAFVTDLGGRTSHTAILARSMGIPAVVGLERITRQVGEGTPVIVDGNSGALICNPDKDTLKKYLELKRRYEFYKKQLRSYCELPAVTADGKHISMQANIEFLQEADIALNNGAQGIGLLRTEFMYMARSAPPSEEEQFKTYKKAAEQFAPYPVTIRTLDIGGDKFVSDITLDDESNPAMGMRSIRLSLWEKKLFRIQLRAILRASTSGNVRLMFPMISGLAEVRTCKKIVSEVMDELDVDGIAFNRDIEVGIMVETPSAVFISDILASEVDFFSIGTNDLIQYCLAVDRGNEHVAYLYEPFHPAILRALRRIAESAESAGIDLSVCGEMAAEPMFSIVLVALGYTHLSMSSQGISRVKKLIRQWDTSKSDELLDALMKQKTASDVLCVLKDRLAEYLPEADPDLDY
jgi:phosphotransferase system enzyme I (PtsI)